MADDPSTPAQPQDPNPQPDNPIPQPNQTDPVPALAPAPAPAPTSTPPSINPNPNPAIPPPQVSFSAAFPVPPSAPSFRPLPQFTPISNYTNPPGVQPPGVTSGAPMVPGAPVPPPQQQQQQHVMHYQMPPQMRPYAPMPNGYPQGTVPPPGLLRYPSPYPAMLRPGFPPRPIGGIGLLPVQRAPMIGIPGVRPILPPAVRPALPIVTPAEKPQTTVYVGKIAPTVDNDFMLYLLQLCGPVKIWKRPQDPTDGTPRAFGFCEFESAEGVLRALRLLSKFNIDGQDLVLNVNQGTREYLERFVEKRTENLKKQKETQAEEVEKEGESTVEKPVLADTAVPDLKEDSNSGNKETNSSNFGIVTDEDREADREAMEKLTSLIEERLKTNPLPPPPPLAPGDGTGNSNSELPTKSRDGDSDVDTRNDASEAKNDEETTSYNRAASEQRPETSSPDRSRKPEKIRERDRDLKQEKEREIERYERETERERIRKEREQRRKIEDAERKFEECLKDWEYREREKHKQRQYEKEREKDRDRKRKNTVIYEEEDEDEDSRKRWRRNTWEEKKKRRQREMDDDYADRLLEEKEIAEANRAAELEKKLQDMRDALKTSSFQLPNGREKADEESCVESKDMAMEQDNESDYGHRNHIGDGTLQNGKTGDESTVASVSAPELQQSGSAPTKKLGFGLVGSGKRTSVPSVFKEEDDDAHKDKKMRPLVPIDYSTEELQAVQPAASGQAPSNLAAAAEFAKQISNVSSKDEKYDVEKERNRRANDRSSHRDRDRNDDDNNRSRDENKEKIGDRDSDREHGWDKPRTTDNKKLLDAKQLIDMIPRTKEELFSYEINWAIYEKHALHERMKPWISKKITEFLGEEETTLVDYIVSSTKEHVGAERMLQLLQSILDEEAEMFVLKMWRMLIFEIKKVETGLPSKTRS